MLEESNDVATGATKTRSLFGNGFSWFRDFVFPFATIEEKSVMLLSRVADALYWIGRYLERAEHVSRIIDVRLDLGLDRRSTSGVWDFRRLYASLGLAEPDAYPTNPTALVECAMFDTVNRDSVIACVTVARDNARQVREEISSDMWEHLNALFLDLKEARLDRAQRPHY